MPLKQCGSCSGTGVIKRGNQLITCRTCNGTGWVGTADKPRRKGR